jgi:hypothetical protein
MTPGSKAPMLPAAEKFYAEVTAHGDAADPSERCLPDGVPNHMLPLPIKIVQNPRVTLMLFEEFTVFRQIFTDGRKLPVDPQPTWFGYSVAHWEQNTLVVESAGFNDKTYIDWRRITALGRPAHRRTLTAGPTLAPVIEFTFTDPKNYSAAVDGKPSVQSEPDTELNEHLCENEKDLVNMYRK